MKIKSLFFQALLLLAISTSANATIFNWDFGFSGSFLAFDTVTGDDFHFGSNTAFSTSEIEYDNVAETLEINIIGLGDVINSVDSSVIVSGASFSFNAGFTDVTGDESIPDLSSLTPGTGSYSVSNVGNIDGIAGDDTISGEFITHLTTLLLSNNIGEGINATGWFSGINDVFVNGVESNALFNATGGDYDLNFGTLRADLATVPEPSTLVLFGLAGLAGAIKKKKSGV